jgi:hypothetical protein
MGNLNVELAFPARQCSQDGVEDIVEMCVTSSARNRLRQILADRTIACLVSNQLIAKILELATGVWPGFSQMM